MKIVFRIFTFLFCCTFLVLDAEVSVNVSRKSIGIHESFSVEFSSDQTISGQPDFTPLQKDFKILTNSQSHSKSIINGAVKQKVSWNLELVTKNEGELVIPSIAFGKSMTRPVKVVISAAPMNEKDETLFLEMDVSPKTSVYEQTQLIVTLRLFRSINLAQGELSNVQVNDTDALVERLGNDVEYEHHHKNGKRYIVLERKYAVMPQHAGELIISPVIFEGRALVNGHSFYNVQTQFKRVASNQLIVDVKPIPAPFEKHNWLASNDVKLVEAWSTDPSLISLGEPITWTLTLSAEGCMGSHLPPINLNLPVELKQYVDKPHIENQPKNGGIVGSRVTKIALIANKAGTLTIPEIVLPWWDLKEERLKEARLPSRTIQVEQASVAMNDHQLELQKPSVLDKESILESSDLPIWAWGLIGMNAIWIIGLVYFILTKVNFKYLSSGSGPKVKSQLKNACKSHDAKQAETLLLAWAAQIFPEQKIHSIIDLKAYVSEEFKLAIDDHNRCLYGNQLKWNGDLLWKSFSAFKIKKAGKVKGKGSLLKPLYPL
jgi:hypothetical protein